jgi:hypothetical protein
MGGLGLSSASQIHNAAWIASFLSAIRLFKDKTLALGDEKLYLYKQVLSLFVNDFSFETELPRTIPIQKVLVATIHERNLETLEGLLKVDTWKAWFKGQKVGRPSWLSVVYFGENFDSVGFSEKDYIRNLQLRLLISPIPEGLRENLSCLCPEGPKVCDPRQAFHVFSCRYMAGMHRMRHDGIVRCLSSAVSNMRGEHVQEIEVRRFWNEEQSVKTPDLAVSIGGVKHWVDVTVRGNGCPSYASLSTKQLLLKGETDKKTHYKDITFDGFYYTFAVDMFGNLGSEADKFLQLLAKNSAKNSEGEICLIADFKRSLSVWMAKSISTTLSSYLVDIPRSDN